MADILKDMKPYNLFLDDMRMPIDCIRYMADPRYETLVWEIVKNHEEFMNLLNLKWENGEYPALVSFDHDLAHEHYHPSMYKGVAAYELIYKGFLTPTGRRSAEYLVTFCRQKSIPEPEYLIHTMNPAGKERIAAALNKK